MRAFGNSFRTKRFQTAFRGEIIQPTDFGYERARKIWNASIDKHPGIIARCAGVADVMAAVNFARENQLLVAVRSGGHNVSGGGKTGSTNPASHSDIMAQHLRGRCHWLQEKGNFGVYLTPTRASEPLEE